MYASHSLPIVGFAWLAGRVGGHFSSPLPHLSLFPVFELLILLTGVVFLLIAVASAWWNRRSVAVGVRSVVGLLAWLVLAWGFHRYTLGLPGRSGTFSETGTRPAVEAVSEGPDLERVLQRSGAIAVEVDKPEGPPPGTSPGPANAGPGTESPGPRKGTASGVPAKSNANAGQGNAAGTDADRRRVDGPAEVRPAEVRPAEVQTAEREEPEHRPPTVRRTFPLGGLLPGTRLKVDGVLNRPPEWGVGPAGDPAGEAGGSTEGNPQFVAFRSIPSAQLGKAVQDVEERASQWLARRFERELNSPVDIPLEKLGRQGLSELVVEEFVREVRLPSGELEPVSMSVAHLRVKLTPATRLLVYGDHRQRVARDRLMPLLGGVLGVSLLLGAIAVGVRIDRLTHHRRRVPLVLGLVGVLAGALLLLARLSPSSTRVSITGRSKGDIHVEQQGFGAQRTRVEEGDVKIETFAW